MSAGGPGTGSIWASGYGSPKELLPNDHWLVAVNERLGALGDITERTCQAVKDAESGEICGARLADEAHHPHNCRAGATRFRPHTNLEHTLARIMKEAGAAVDIERYIPHLYDEVTKDGVTKTREAIMDVVVNFPGTWVTALVDVSIRSPHVERYKRSIANPGLAARIGEEDKDKRYGHEVLPLVFETFGRL